MALVRRNIICYHFSVSLWNRNSTVTLVDISRYITSCRKHSVMAVNAYLQVGYIPFIGFVPGTQVLILWPKMLFILMTWPSTSRPFIDFMASLVQMHRAKIFTSSIAFKSLVLLSSRSINLLQILRILGIRYG